MTALPTFHLNGSDVETLMNEYEAVCTALRKAVVTLEKATCNPRDFYVQEDGAWERARAERTAMFAKLRGVQSYAEAWAECASDAYYAKRK